MPEALGLLPWLLVPVVALVFLTLRLSRRLVYPHDLLAASERRGMASLLLRSLRLHYDILLDGLLAVILAFALLPPAFRRPSAVVIDGSRAMVAGLADGRPLAKALKRLRTDAALGQAEPFLLVQDPRTGTTRLEPLRKLLAGLDREEAIRSLRERYEFLAPDYAGLAELRARGFGAVTLLTDQLRIRPEGFQAIELGFAGEFAAYPAAARFDRPSGTWLAALAESGPRAALAVAVWDAREGQYRPLAPDRYRIEEGGPGRIIRFPAPGLYRLTLKGPFGLDDLQLPILLPPKETAGRAVGPFSERMLSVFPDVERGRPPKVVLVDADASRPAGVPSVVTTRTREDGQAVLDPAATGGALLAAGTGPGLVLGPSSLANEDLVLAYEAVLAPSGSARELLPASQFFEVRPGPRLSLPPPAESRWPWVLALGVLAGLKLVLWRRLSGRSLFVKALAGPEP